MQLKTYVLAIMILGITSEVSYSETSFNLLQLYQSEAIIVISSPEKSIKIATKKSIGDVHWGFLFDHNFYAIDSTYDKELLLITDLKAMKTKVLLDFKKIMDVSYRPITVQCNMLMIIKSLSRHTRMTILNPLTKLIHFTCSNMTGVWAIYKKYPLILIKVRFQFMGSDCTIPAKMAIFTAIMAVLNNLFKLRGQARLSLQTVECWHTFSLGELEIVFIYMI